MFEHTKAFSGFSVDDIHEARRFYGETLGLRLSEDNGMLTLHIAGDRDTLVYPKEDHTPATYTILNFANAPVHPQPRRRPTTSTPQSTHSPHAASRSTPRTGLTRRGSCAPTARRSPGSPTRRATSCRSSS